MKKLLYCAAALALGFFAGSCQRENLEPVAGNGQVTFTVEAPAALQTRTIADGLNVDELVYEVWLTENLGDLTQNAQKLYQAKADMAVDQNDGKNKATLTLDLVNDQKFTVLFWAQVGGTGVYNTTELNAVTYTHKEAEYYTANDENLAAFYAVAYVKDCQHVKQNGDPTVSEVTLRRPFAQLNLGTLNTSTEYTVDLVSSKVKVTNANTVFNVATSKASAPQVMEFRMNGVPTNPATLTVNTTDYEYAGMNYLFAGDNVTVEYDIVTKLNGGMEGKVNNTVSSVPLKENYRTNIVGNLLTSKVDYQIVVDAEFISEYYGPDFVLVPAYDQATKTWTITNRDELLYVAQQVNSGANSFKGQTVQLVNDIDLENIPWTPIGNKKHFQGVFEGVASTRAADVYPTISNLKIENGEKAGLFGRISDGALLRNFNLKHVRISGSNYLGAVVGEIYTAVDNVTVEDAEIIAVPTLLEDGVTYDGGAKVGGIAGLVGQSATITNCTVKDATFSAYRDLGGIVGTTQWNYPTTLTDNTVENLQFVITSFYAPYKDNDAAGHYAPIRGGKRSNAGDVIENNTGDDITLHKVLDVVAEGGVYDPAAKVYTVTSPAGLARALQGSGAAGAGNHTIEIVGDLDMTDIDWTPINIDGYNGADIVTVEGNEATIKGLDAALFAGGFAGGSGIVIKDLTIEDAHMIADNTQGYGAFVNCADSMDEITLINCHLKNSTIITPNDGAAESRIGGLVGWTAGYNKQNDGPVDSYITIQNCSVTGCTIKGAGSIGGICGHAGANAATFTKIENCTVTGNTLVSTDDGDWRVGAIVGTANNGQCVINEVTVSGNTISQVGKTPEAWQSELYGRFVPSGTGTLTIDGVAVSSVKPARVNGYTALYTCNGEYQIYNLQGLKDFHAFIKANTGRHPYDKVYNIMNDIDADGWEWNSINVIPDAGDAKGLVLNGNGHTISNLVISGEGMFNSGSAGAEIKNLTMDRATATSTGHNAAIFWGSVYSSVAFDNVHVKNSTINGLCNTGAFVGGTYEPNNLVVTFKDCSVEKSSLTAEGYDGQDPTGASGFLGKAYGSTKVVFEGANAIDDDTEITNKNTLVGGKVYGYTIWSGGDWAGTGACNEFENFDGIQTVAKVGNTEYFSINEAVANWTNGSTLTLLADVTLSDVITLKSTEHHILNLGTYTMTAAKGKDAISITAEGRSSASYALDIKADETNPGGITATGKAVVKTKGKSGVKDRPIIRFYNGIFTATNIIYHSGSNGTNCPQFQFHNGEYYGTIYANRALIQFYGGTFHGSLQMSVDSSAYALISGGRFKQLTNLYGSTLNKDKFTIGSSKGNFDRGIYVDNEGYYVVGGSVITDFGDKFAAKVTISTNSNAYLTYSSAAIYGLYYTDASRAGNGTNVEFRPQ